MLRVWASPVPVEMPTVKAYLFAIARRLFLTEVNKQSRSVELPETIAAPAVVPDHGIELERVMAGLALLPELERSALLLRAEHGLSYQEIATALGIRAATARVKVHRARLNLAAAAGVRKRT